MDPVDYNFAHSISVFGSTGKTGEVLEARDFVLFNSKAPVPEFNQAVLKTPRYKLARTLDRVWDFYGRAKVPFRMHVLVDDAAITSELLGRGFTRAQDVPCMVYEGARCEAPTARGLRIATVQGAEGLADFQRVAFGGFGYPVEIAPVALTEDLIAVPQFAAFVGYVDGSPACCSAIIQTGDVTGIYWVSTLAAHRKLGLGAAITAHAVNEGLARGAKRVCLQASAMGFPVYKRIGFSHPRTYLRFDHAAL